MDELMSRTWNVAATVVDLIDAEDGPAAIERLRARLHAAGFDMLEGSGDAFESDAEAKR